MAMNQTSMPAADSDTRIMAIIVYGLYLVGWPCLHLPTVAGLILAYIKRDDARGTIWESHFDNQIQVFWISLVGGVAAIALCLTVVGLVVGLPMIGILVVWFLYRTIKGLIRAIEGRPYNGQIG
ncbi:MAG TPA: hypothetical protein VG889_17845 [Rhizomicrobium sp.]|nr:hypothetical protein [Rhizomicrobium sp.]